MRATIKDIAEKVGVSKSLVSMYLNNHPLSARIAEKTKKKIDDVVKEMDYQPSSTARALKNGKSKTIGLVTGDITGIYSSFYAQALLNEALKYNYQLLLSITRYNQEEEKRCLENLIHRQTDGILYGLHLVPDDRIRRLLAGYPILLFSSAVLPEYNSYVIDLRPAMQKAFRDMQKAGYKRICELSMSSIEEGWATLVPEFAGKSGMEFSRVSYNEVPVKEVYETLMERKIDCVLCGSSTMPLKIIYYCIENDIRKIPRFLYSYTLPCDFINHEAVFGVIVNPFKPQVEKRIERIIEMIEHPETEVKHFTIPGTYLNYGEIREYYREQAKDPYYKIIIEERGYLLNKKGK